MGLSSNIATGKRRYEALLSGAATAAHDYPLLEREDWLVAPTLGPIVPNWLLAITRRSVLNFRDWATTGGESPESVLRHIRDHLGLAPDEVLWFEHGPSTAGTSIGCGLDHAHIHVLVRPGFTFGAFAAQARALAHTGWREVPAESGYAALQGDASYCIAGSGERAILASGVERVGSQFFRRVVGTLAGLGAEWDYRQFPHSDNIACTIRTFRLLESAARRDQ